MNEKTLTSEQRATLIAYILMTTKMWEIEDGVLPGQIELDDLLSDEDYDE